MKAALLAALTGCAGLASCAVYPAGWPTASSEASASGGSSSGGSSKRSGKGSGSSGSGSTGGGSSGSGSSGSTSSGSGSSGSSSSGSSSPGDTWVCRLPGFAGFAQPVATYPLGTQPCGVAAGDFNGDGLLDLAVATGEINEVAIYLNQGDGGFVSGPALVVGGVPPPVVFPLAVVAADFDGDGWLDLATANNEGNTVSVFRNQGGGTFDPVPATYAVGGSPSSLAVADFNGDGLPDLAVANAFATPDGGAFGTVGVLFNQGDGGFAPPVTWPVGSQPFSVAAGDFNGDGLQDLAVANSGDATVGVLFNQGDGGFAAQVTYAVNGSDPDWLAVADFNGDGAADLAVVLSGASQVEILLGDGGGGFVPSPQTLYVGSGPYAVVTGDFDGDGRPDLAVTNGGNDNQPDPDTVSVLINDGNGGFAGQQTFAVGTQPFGAATGDFRHLGRSDLAVANRAIKGSPSVSVLLNLGGAPGDGGFAPQKLLDAGLMPSSVVLADFDGDGRLDIAVANYGDDMDAGTVSVFTNQGDGGFAAATWAAGVAPTGVAAGDFNGDGRPDLAVSNGEDGTVGVLLNLAGGGFAAQVTYAVTGTSASLFPSSLAVGDLEGNGRLDIAVTSADDNGNGLLSLLVNQPGGTFALGQSLAAGVNPAALVVADLNGDGLLDLAFACNPGSSDAGTVGVYLNQGGGSFNPDGIINYYAGVEPVGLAVGDFDGDGRLDFAVANQGESDVGVFMNLGDAGFAAQVTYAVGLLPAAVAVGDFNGDGVPDLATANNGASTVSVLLGLGDGGFAPALVYAAGAGPAALAAGGLAGDGRSDLAVADGEQNAVSVFLSACSP